jgi:hypothetical protein
MATLRFHLAVDDASQGASLAIGAAPQTATTINF